VVSSGARHTLRYGYAWADAQSCFGIVIPRGYGTSLASYPTKASRSLEPTSVSAIVIKLEIEHFSNG